MDLVRGDDLGLEVSAEVGVAEQGEVLWPLAGEDAFRVLVDGRAQVVHRRRRRHQRRAAPTFATHCKNYRRRAPRQYHGGRRRRRQRDGKDGLDGGIGRRGRHGRDKEGDTLH